MNQWVFVNTENQVNHKNEKHILNYAKIQVLCITSILSNNDNNISVTLYKTQPKKESSIVEITLLFIFNSSFSSLPACEFLYC